MNEIIERVAKAIDAASQPPGQKDYKILMENAARAAIEAMREPTDDMYAVAFKIEEERYAVHHPQEDMCAGDCWKAMIDKALA